MANLSIHRMSTYTIALTKVEDILFCVPREGFEQSKVFVNLFGVTSTVHKQSTTGIKDIKAHEFEAFLKLLIRQ